MPIRVNWGGVSVLAQVCVRRQRLTPTRVHCIGTTTSREVRGCALGVPHAASCGGSPHAPGREPRTARAELPLGPAARSGHAGVACRLALALGPAARSGPRGLGIRAGGAGGAAAARVRLNSRRRRAPQNRLLRPWLGTVFVYFYIVLTYCYCY